MSAPAGVQTGPSPHLTWDELACHDELRTPYPLDWRGTRAATLAREFEAVRAALAVRVGRPVPLVVHSGYRTRAYNARIGGADQSQHCEGRALDVAPSPIPYVDAGSAVTLLWEVVVARARSVLAIRGIGRYDTFVHLDVRPTARLVQWDERTKR